MTSLCLDLSVAHGPNALLPTNFIVSAIIALSECMSVSWRASEMASARCETRTLFLLYNLVNMSDE